MNPIGGSREKRFFAGSLVLLVLISFEFFHISANPAPFNPFDDPSNPQINPGTGQFLFYGDHNLTLENADVKINLVFGEDIYSNLKYKFDGNYTVYNPDNELNLTICAPFDPRLWKYGLNLSISIMNYTIEINDMGDSDILDQHPLDYQYYNDFYYEVSTFLYSLTPISGIPYYRIFLIIEDVSFPENSSVNIQYHIESVLPIEKELEDSYLTLYYDLFTASAWNGNINESVEIIVEGFEPFEYYTLHDRVGEEQVDSEIIDINSSETFYRDLWLSTSCYITSDGNITSYKWQWENKRIIDQWVYVKFLIPKHIGTIIGHYSMIVGISLALLSPFIVVVIIIIIEKRKKKRKLTHNKIVPI